MSKGVFKITTPTSSYSSPIAGGVNSTSQEMTNGELGAIGPSQGWSMILFSTLV